ncbi:MULTISPECIES: competence protein CoiA family protein [unclassified Enterococcus]|uniref:competence protein CoiA n=1 Tax=unclassified Enterococcus TaxID=2608891 RepID=UPI0024766D75|nr:MULTISPECIES: competence protein CoiA family protein [unclassified Enterococcus]
MLIAETTSGEIINLLDFSGRQELLQGQFYCPTCHSPLIFKNGKIKMPHFAHYPQADCHSFSEGETLEHLIGKRLFYQWGAGAALLEAALPDLPQRPDLLFPQRLVIEFQCSPLSSQRLQERVAGYHAKKYQQWWLLGGRLAAANKLTPLTRNFCYFNQRLGFHFWQLLCQRKQVILYYHLQELWQHQQLAEKVVFSFEKESLNSVLQFLQTFQPKHRWSYQQGLTTAYQQQLMKKLGLRDKKILTIQGLLYQRQGHLLQLPAILYSSSQFYLYFGDWLLYFRFLIYQLFLKKAGHSLKSLYQLFLAEVEPFSEASHFPLVNQQLVWACFFTETWLLLTTGAKNQGKLDNIYQLPLKNMVR